MSNEWEIDNLPNRLTMFRVVLIPIIVFSLYAVLAEYEWALNHTRSLNYLAAWTFVLASITDFFDGYLARKRNLVTVFGSFLDPIADKFLVIASLVMLLALNRVDAIIVLILILRELYITSLRLLASEKQLTVPVSKSGKWKAAIQMVGIPLLMAYDIPFSLFGVPLDMPMLGTITIYLAAFLSILSAMDYSVKLLKKLKRVRKQKKLNKIKANA